MNAFYKKKKFYSIIFNLLLKTFPIKEKNKICRIIWQRTADHSFKKYKGPINAAIHGYPVEISNGYTYPVTSRSYKTFNNPLLELANLTAEIKKTPICIVDIGSAVGDTALFLIANADKQIDKIYCIDGDSEFFNYLIHNVKNIKKINPLKALLSDGDRQKEAALIRIHLGTASAQGELLEDAITLDGLLLDSNARVSQIDLIKVDVDGFDGKVLAGSTKILMKFKPTIIFEWHPVLYNKTKNDIHRPFQILQENGYSKFVWFDKYGNFSHFDNTHSREDTERMAQVCMNGRHEFDWHYDVIAIHKETELPLVKLAEMQYAKNKRSMF